MGNADNLSTQARCGFASGHTFQALTPITWAIPDDLGIQVFDVEPNEASSCSVSSYASSVTGSAIVRAMGRLATSVARVVCAAIGIGSCWSIHRQGQSNPDFCPASASLKRRPLVP